jgi:flagella basal body P-ring formation protein FlgA
LNGNPIGICPVTQSSQVVGNALVPVIATAGQLEVETE